MLYAYVDACPPLNPTDPTLHLSIFPYLYPACVDFISAVEFNGSGEYFATGDRGGRVVVFQRVRNMQQFSLSAAALPRTHRERSTACF